MLTTWFHDLRVAARTLRQSPGFTLAAVASLALGLGANTAIFSLVSAVLLRPLPVARPGELAAVFTSGEDGSPHSSTSYPDYLDLAEQSSAFSGLLGHSLMFAPLNREGRSELVMGEVVTGNYFQVLGVEAELGRTLQPADAAPGAPPAAVLGHSFWRREFGADPGLLGRTIKIRGLPVVVAGVAPARFAGLTPGVVPDLWLPVSLVEEVEPVGIQDVVPSPTGATRLEQRGRRWLFV